ncbi:SufE family protein [Synoicihabitans lomoniglobus]|uniref:SufE family protein n=1 Tax=Synoicihabitans lomoniglobus TaxID=2909285 RepID=A0AAF0CPN0_9BACT|nr:SufE family protein [Opitutaceae bacterium LMO-M01]WED65599.1 SufE family protein [Opitutaceae bacterium LMO-M01]
MTVRDLQHQLIEDYGFIENRQERLGAIVDAARTQPTFSEDERNETHLVPGCTSRVWLIGEYTEGVCRFRSDCDSPMVRGLVALLCKSYDGVAPADAASTASAVLEELGVTRDLSPTRQNGLAAVRQRIAALARGWM